MKTIINILILTLFLSLNSWSQKTIVMEEYNGIYRIPCTVNGAKMKFVFDTGASNVCLSMSMAEYLFDNDYITKKDILGVGKSSVADGRIVNHVNILLKDINIDGIHLNNVKAVVIEGQNAPLLMGQTAIQKLGSIEINGNILTIKNGSNDDLDAIDKLFEEADQAMSNKFYNKAAEKYAQLYAMNQLSEYGIFSYANACFMNGDYNQAWDVLSKIEDFDYYIKNDIDIYFLMGSVCFGLRRFRDASRYYNLRCEKMYINDKMEWYKSAFQSGMSLYFNEDYDEAARYFLMAIECYAIVHNVDRSYIIRDCKNRLKKRETSYRNAEIDEVLFYYCICNYRSNNWNTESYFLELAALARAGNKEAIKECNALNIDPHSGIW